MMKRWGGAAIAAVVVLSSAVAGYGVAAAAGDTGVVVCQTSNGTLRASVDGACKKGEVPLDLTGPQGEPGQAGEPGPQGEPGVQGPAGAAVGPTYKREDYVLVAPQSAASLDVYCDSGDYATGGGYQVYGEGIEVRGSSPIIDEWSESPAVLGWRLQLQRDPMADIERPVWGFVVCSPS